MSDVSKTSELIFEARAYCVNNSVRELAIAGLVGRLADALEAKTGVRVDMSSAVGVETQLSATRVPEQGEASGGQEALRDFTMEHYDEDDNHMGKCVLLTDIERAGFSRAVVPDAASAAIERVRAILYRTSPAGSGFYLNPDRTELDMLRDLYDDKFADELVAALDGAPEPEAGTKVVIGKQARANEDECWTFTVWDPSELEEAREKFPRGAYEVVTVFGLPVEGKSNGE